MVTLTWPTVALPNEIDIDTDDDDDLSLILSVVPPATTVSTQAQPPPTTVAPAPATPVPGISSQPAPTIPPPEQTYSNTLKKSITPHLLMNILQLAYLHTVAGLVRHHLYTFESIQVLTKET